MADNSTKVQQGFRILLPLFSGYVAREIKLAYGKNWWQEILSTLSDQLKDLPDEGDGDWNRLAGSLDMANCIRLLDRKWNDLFRKKLSLDYRTWAKELMGVRNTLSHIGTDDFSDDDAWRALDTMARLCTAFDDEAADEIRGLIREVRYGSAQGSTAVSEASPAVLSTLVSNPQGNGPSSFPNGLPSWREIMQPHQDVAQGVYKKAEFAADLNQVAKGEGSLEYLDPVEFFGRTYLTEGLKGLLVQALRRVNGRDGEPVIQLKTAFGGGKTHSMLALYHMMRGKVTTAKVPSLIPVVEEAEAPGLPRANVAVLVGTALDPTRTRRPPEMPGVQIYTLWGEMAAQLAASAENPALYEMVREADKKGVSPGSATMKELFDACGPCLILMDELVAYARKLYGAEGLPAGTYGNFITFIQEVTEAARASKNSLVVATIPESKMEIGDESGRIALEAIEHTFGRMESIWKPVAANEGFEVVRRRLFLNCKDEAAREAVCTAFSRMYNENKGDFPTETREEEYRQRMISCYPIHPEVFDRLYEDWATLESFQRTRGVLRFMAAVIHELWMGRDASAMIMPGSVPMNVPNVREELTRYLKSTDERGGMPESWNAIVDREVDGRRSIPWQKDQAVPRFGGKWASRRVARTIFLGSAPTDRSQSIRGLQATRIRLGVIQPGEGIADFNDALNTLTTSLAYLYSSSSGDRFWYDTRPNLRKTMEDRASQVTATDVEYELEKRLKNLKKRSPFMGLHICPGTSLDVADEQSARLVILRPGDTYSLREDEKRSNAIQSAEEILSKRGTSPRIYRNMLAFVAPDKDTLGSLQQEVRRYLAWESIQNERVELNLDAAQNKETNANLKRSDENVDLQIRGRGGGCWFRISTVQGIFGRLHGRF